MMNKVWILLVVSLVLSCDSEETSLAAKSSLQLPSNVGTDGSDCPTGEVSLNDIAYLGDRVVIGTVTSVTAVSDVYHMYINDSGEIVRDSDTSDCELNSYRWAIKVEISDVEPLDGGDAGDVSFVVDPFQAEAWNSLGMTKIGDVWTPNFVEPTVELNDSFGWSGESGFQSGQRIGVFLQESDIGHLTLAKLPVLDASDDGTLRGTSDFIYQSCQTAKSLNSTTAEQLRAQLETADATQASVEIQALKRRAPFYLSTCSPAPTQVLGPDMGHD